MFLAVGDGRGIWCIPGVCLYLARHTSVPPCLEGVGARARAGRVVSAGAPALGMGPEPRSTMRCAFRVGDGSKGRCRLDCPECENWRCRRDLYGCLCSSAASRECTCCVVGGSVHFIVFCSITVRPRIWIPETISLAHISKWNARPRIRNRMLFVVNTLMRIFCAFASGKTN